MLVIRDIGQSGQSWGRVIKFIYDNYYGTFTVINDLPDVIKDSHIFLFADDMKLFNPIYNEENCNNLQKGLTSAEKWSETSLLKFHPDKYCNMIIGRSSIRNDGYTMGTMKTINKAETVRDIGVTFDSSLNLNT